MYRIVNGFLINSRTFTITFYPIENQKDTLEEVIEVNHFGLIKTLVFEYPLKSKIDFESLIRLLVRGNSETHT